MLVQIMSFIQEFIVGRQESKKFIDPSTRKMDATCSNLITVLSEHKVTENCRHRLKVYKMGPQVRHAFVAAVLNHLEI